MRNIKEANNIPKRMVDIKERVCSWHTDIKFAQISEDDFEKDHKKKVYAKLRKRLIKMFDKVFNEDHTPADRLDILPVKIPLVPPHEDVTPNNSKIPIDTSRYLDTRQVSVKDPTVLLRRSWRLKKEDF